VGLLIEMTSPTWGHVEVWARGWQWAMGRMDRNDAEHLRQERFFGAGRGKRWGGGHTFEVAMGRFCIWMAYGPEARKVPGGEEADLAIGSDVAA